MNFISQFILDSPRIDIFIDDKNISKEETPEAIWFRLLRGFGMNFLVAMNCAWFLTQESLADLYMEKIKDMQDDEHLLSHYKHDVKIDTISGIVTIIKEFRHVLILDAGDYTIDYYTLNIVYDPWSNKFLNIQWIKEFDFKNNDKILLIDI